MPIIKTLADIKIMTEGGSRLAEIIEALKKEIKVGTSTKSLNELTRVLIKQRGATPAFLGYRPNGSTRPFEAALCVSINDVIVHGLPSDYLIKSGDLVKLDLGIKYKGFYVDAAVTIGVEKISPLAEKLIAVTEQTLSLAIAAAKAGNTIGDIGWAIENYATRHNFSVIKSLTGHGIGKDLHEEPSVLNFGRPGGGQQLEAGIVLAIEPMISAAPPPHGGKIKQLPDDSFTTQDGSLSAHFEHTVAVTEEGPKILTKI